MYFTVTVLTARIAQYIVKLKLMGQHIFNWSDPALTRVRLRPLASMFSILLS